MKRTVLAAVLVTAAFALGACGGGDDPADARTIAAEEACAEAAVPLLGGAEVAISRSITLEPDGKGSWSGSGEFLIRRSGEADRVQPYQCVVTDFYGQLVARVSGIPPVP